MTNLKDLLEIMVYIMDPLAMRILMIRDYMDLREICDEVGSNYPKVLRKIRELEEKGYVVSKIERDCDDLRNRRKYKSDISDLRFRMDSKDCELFIVTSEKEVHLKSNYLGKRY